MAAKAERVKYKGTVHPKTSQSPVIVWWSHKTLQEFHHLWRLHLMVMYCRPSAGRGKLWPTGLKEIILVVPK